jgi:colanic acid biosynthesis glycosyl transferase WcaI
VRILLIHRHFWPDTPPYAAMLRSIGKRFVDEGHDVVVFSSQPSYKSGAGLDRRPAIESLDGMVVHRISLFGPQHKNIVFTFLNVLYFPLRTFLFCLLSTRVGLIMASTAPPVLVGFAAAMGAKLRGTAFFYHCMDIHPEIGRISGEFRNPLLFRFLRRLDSISCGIARQVVVLSADMKKSLLARPHMDASNIVVINNFPMPLHGETVTPANGLLKAPDKFRIVFTGNIGRFQALENFVAAMAKLSHYPQIELVFVGEGKALHGLRERAAGAKNVNFVSHKPVSIARSMMANADLGIVSLESEIYRYAFPSKTMAYLAEGCPLIVSVERNSELVDMVESRNVGIWVERNSPQAIANAIESLYLNRERHQQMRANAKLVAEERFSEKVVMDEWLESIDNIVGTASV